MNNTRNFKLFTSQDVEPWIASNAKRILDIVEKTYLQFSQEIARNPDSYFLRFPDSSMNRIIALPAHIDDSQPIAGIKWISSFPANVHNGLNRASSAIILNDRVTGYPIACLEGSQISSSRTAASATVGVKYLHKGMEIKCLGVIGTGLISLETVHFLINVGYRIDEIKVHDRDNSRAEDFREKVESIVPKVSVKVASLEDAIRESDLILFATSAVEPYVDDMALFQHNPTVLHMSLRDLATNIIKNSYNFSDDIDHSIKAGSSLHLTEMETGNRSFMVSGAEGLIKKTIEIKYDKPRIFSPFGMGVLDLAVAREIYKDIIPSFSTNHFNP